MGIVQISGGVITVLGATINLWCVATFAVVGRGTPLPFDPPRRLVVNGPYRFVRNPMAIGFGLALLGVALIVGSLGFAAFVVLFMLGIHAMVTLYEEPTLRRTFGAEYVAYCEKVHRWLPRRPEVP
jgi:protein-S-isoprenylcysteine O-methyltransferase Ste14